MNKTISSRLTENNSCQFRKIAGNGFRLAIEITRKCNLMCKHCFVKCEALDINTEKLFEILEFATDYGCKKVILTGGEPLLNKDLIPIISKCTSLNILTDLNSNLYTLDQRMVDDLKNAKVGEVSISLYGTELVHDNLTTTKGSYSKVIEGIGLLKKNNIPVDIHSIIWENNLDDLPNLARLSENLGAESLTFFKVLNKGTNSVMNEFKLENEKILEKIDFLRSKVKIPVRLVGLGDVNSVECQMGLSILGLDVNLILSPCLLSESQNFGIDLTIIDFDAAITELNKQIQDNIWVKKCRNYY